MYEDEIFFFLFCPMMKCLFTAFLFVGVLLSVASAQWDIRDHLSTKTMYTPKNDFSAPPDTCSPVQVNLVARHGARYPTSSDIQKFDALAEKMRQYAALYKPGYEWMGNWTNPYSMLFITTIFNSHLFSTSASGRTDLFRSSGTLQHGSAYDGRV